MVVVGMEVFAIPMRETPNKSLHQTIAPVTPCANAQATPAPLAGEANVSPMKEAYGN